MRVGWSLGTRLGLEVGPPPPTEAVRLALSSCVAGTHSESPGSLSLSVSWGRGHELLETMLVSVQVPQAGITCEAAAIQRPVSSLSTFLTLFCLSRSFYKPVEYGPGQTFVGNFLLESHKLGDRITPSSTFTNDGEDRLGVGSAPWGHWKPVHHQCPAGRVAVSTLSAVFLSECIRVCTCVAVWTPGCCSTNCSISQHLFISSDKSPHRVGHLGPRNCWSV